MVCANPDALVIMSIGTLLVLPVLGDPQMSMTNTSFRQYQTNKPIER